MAGGALAFLSKPGVSTPIALRRSTVAGHRVVRPNAQFVVSAITQALAASRLVKIRYVFGDNPCE